MKEFQHSQSIEKFSRGKNYNTDTILTKPNSISIFIFAGNQINWENIE